MMGTSTRAELSVAAMGAVFDRAPVPVAVVEGATFEAAYVNPAMAALLSASREDLVGRSMVAILRLGEDDVLANAIVRATASDSDVIFETDREGEVHGRWRAWALRDEASGVTHFVVTACEDPLRVSTVGHDLREVNSRLLVTTLRVRDEADLAQRARAQLEALLDSQNDGLVIVDSAGHVVLINAAGRALLEIPTATQAAELSLSALAWRSAQGTALVPHETPFARAATGESYRGLPFGFVTAAHGTRDLVFSATNVRDAGAGVTLAIVGFRDETELRRLGRLREEYTWLVSHDLRGPVAAILAFAEVLRRDLRRHGLVDQIERVDRITSTAARIDDMIKELLDAAQAESRPDEMSVRSHDLDSILREMLDAIDDASRARIEYLAPTSPVRVAVDRLQIERAVANVVRNALKYSPESERVTISTSADADCATIHVTDRGRGIPPEERERIFERFYRAGTRGTAEGLGLGLYIAALVVRAHHGRIWVDAATDRGSTFHIRVPKLVGEFEGSIEMD